MLLIQILFLCFKVYNWLVFWWCSLVHWNFCFNICANGLSRETRTHCMCSGCKFYCIYKCSRFL